MFACSDCVGANQTGPMLMILTTICDVSHMISRYLISCFTDFPVKIVTRVAGKKNIIKIFMNIINFLPRVTTMQIGAHAQECAHFFFFFCKLQKSDSPDP